MGINTKIEWSDHTFNIVWGCSKVSEACQNCYAEALAKRWGHDVWGADAPRRIMSDAYWKQPIKWNQMALEDGVRRRVFCSSMADVFEDHETVAQERLKLWPLIEATPMLDWLLLTKRPQNMREFAPWKSRWPSNVWAMTTAETQARLDERWKHLRKVPASVLGLSIEPMLSKIDLRKVISQIPEQSILWVIAGGESGRKVRPTPPDWFRLLRDQCSEGDVAFHFKQWGVISDDDGKRVEKAKAGRELDGREWNGVPKLKV